MTRARSSSRPLLINSVASDPPTTTISTSNPTPILSSTSIDQQSSLSSSDEPSSVLYGSLKNRHDKFYSDTNPNQRLTNLPVNGLSDSNQPSGDLQSFKATNDQQIGQLEITNCERSDEDLDNTNNLAFDDSEETRLTAIYRPTSSAVWKEQLRLAVEREKKRMMLVHKKEGQNPQDNNSIDEKRQKKLRNDDGMVNKTDEELARLSLNDHEDQQSNDSLNQPGNLRTSSTRLDRRNSSTIATNNGQKGLDGYKIWKPKRTLRSHLDAARSIAFDKTGLAIVSGGDDCTVKLWRLNPISISNPSPPSWPETEPQITFRGHSAAITSVAISSSPPRIYSASLDSTVSVWSLPPPEHETYAPYDPRSLLATFVGHTDAIWDMVLLPLRLRDEALLATVSADGTVKVWSTDELNSPLKLSWGYDGIIDESAEEGLGEEDEREQKEVTVVNGSGEKVRVTPTSVAIVWSDLKKVAVAYTNSIIRLFELETGKMVLQLKSDETFDGTTATQVNKIVTHPTLPLLISAHEDRYIRLYDLNTGSCTHSMLGHLDSVTSLSIDPTGLILVSGGHDCSIRFWDLSGSRICIQEISSHRPKSNQEGILDVLFHFNLPFIASSGSDGTVKIFG